MGAYSDMDNYHQLNNGGVAVHLVVRYILYGYLVIV